MKSSGNTHQTSMFDVQNHDGNTTVAPSRRSDPATSKSAAERVQLTPNQRLFLQTARRMNVPRSAHWIGTQAVVHEPGMSDAQVRKRRETVRKRASEVKKLGFARVVEQSYCTLQESNCEKFELTKEGERWLKEN